MATYYWVGGTGNWDGTSTHWASSSGGAGGAGVPGSADSVNFDTNSGTGTVTATASYSVAACTVNKTGLTLTHSSGITSTVSGAMTLTIGGLTTNGVTCSWGSFSSANTNTRSLNISNSSITITAATGWSISAATNMTFTSTGSTLTFTGTAAIFAMGANMTYGAVVASGAGAFQFAYTSVSGVNAMTSFTRTGTAALSDSVYCSSSNFPTISGALTLTGSGVGARLLAYTATAGNPATWSAGSTSLTNVDFQDVHAGGAASWTGTSIGDCGGNSGITFDASRTLYAVGAATASWNLPGTWATSSGGASGANPPLPQDDVVIDSNSSTITTNGYPRLCRSLTQSAAKGVTQSVSAPTIFGNLSIQGAGFSLGLTLSGRGSQTITMANGTQNGNSLTVNAPGGTYTNPTALTTTGAFTVTAGTFTAGANVTANNFAVSGTLNMGSYTWTATGTLFATMVNFAAGATINAGTSTIVAPANPVVAQLFTGGGHTYYNLVLAQGGSYTFSGNNTFNQITVPYGTGVVNTAGATQTVGTLSASGQRNGFQDMPGATGNYVSAPVAATDPLQITNGTVTLEACINPNSLTVTQALVGRWSGIGTYNYLLYLNTSGQVLFNSSTSAGAAGTTAVSTVTLQSAGYAAGQTFWVRASVTGGVVTFYTAPDGVTWTQLGATRSAATSWASGGTQPVEFGSTGTGTGNLFAGAIYRARVYAAAIGSGTGTPIIDANFAVKVFGANSFTDATGGYTVSITGALAQLGDGRIGLSSSTSGTPGTLSSASSQMVSYAILQDWQGGGAGAPHTAAQSVNNGDNAGWVFSTAVTASDTVSVSDSTRSSLVLVRKATDTVSVSDTVSRSVALVRQAMDVVAVSDTASRSVALVRQTVNTVSVSDVVLGTRSLSRSTSNVVSVSDTASRSIAIVRMASDSVSISDTVSDSVALVRGTTNVVSVFDSVTSVTHAFVKPVWVPVTGWMASRRPSGSQRNPAPKGSQRVPAPTGTMDPHAVSGSLTPRQTGGTLDH